MSHEKNKQAPLGVYRTHLHTIFWGAPHLHVLNICTIIFWNFHINLEIKIVKVLIFIEGLPNHFMGGKHVSILV